MNHLPTDQALLRLADPAKPLTRNSVYRSPEGRARLWSLYQKSIEELPFPLRHKMVPTSYGQTFLSIAGDPDAPPLFILPGMSIAGPMMLEFFADLQKTHLLIAPDLIGQPGHSEDRPFPNKKGAYGQWAFEVLDQLDLHKIGMASASFGGSIALEMTAMAPERVGKQALVVPAGLTPNLPYLKLYLGLAVNWLTYRWWPFHKPDTISHDWLQRIARPLSRSLTPDNLDYFDSVIRHTEFWRHRPAGPFKAGDFSENVTPTFAIFAQKDFVFPHAPTLANAKQSLPMAHMEILEHSAHMPSETDMAPMHQRISDYFDGEI
jgi:pimeloyl-ACP methyl ester carboxylesterase